MNVQETQSETLTSSQNTANNNTVLLWLIIFFLIYLIMLSVGMIGGGFKWASGGKEGAAKLFEFATNPFMGLVMGSFATALVQSSSTVTSVIVALVAGGLPVGIAIPMVMGANIGTTVTNTLVSLGHVRNGEEFQRAFAAATVHDFFNLIAVVMFLPLEYATGILEKLSHALADRMVGGGEIDITGLNFVKTLTKPVIHLFDKNGLFGMLPDPFGAISLIIFGICLIFFSIFFLGKFLKKVLTGKAQAIFHTAVGKGPLSGIFSGTVITILVQSSSTTTSLAVPLAGTGVLKLKEVYPFTLGANIGTTITAMIASTAVTTNPVYALEIALVHFFYNVLSVMIIFGIPVLRNIPLKCATWLSGIALKNRLLAIAYIICVFFLVPVACIAVYSTFTP